MQNSPSDQNNCLMVKTLKELKDIVHEIRKTYTEMGIPIDDDSTDFHKFCAKLEFILYYGTKDRTGIFGSKRRSPYDFFAAVLAKTKSAHDCLQYVHYNREIRTSAGKLRCFVRYSLFHRCLADTIQWCIADRSTISDFYDPTSVFTSAKSIESFISTLYDLNDVQFDLNPAGFDLDTGWPTFAKKQFAGYNWRTPSVYSSPASQSGSLSSDVTSPRFLRRSLFSRSVSETESSKMENSVSDSNGTEEQLSAAEQQIEQLTQANCKMEDEIKSLTEQLQKAQQNTHNFESKLELLENCHNLEISKLQKQVEELQQQLQINETNNQLVEENNFLDDKPDVDLVKEELDAAKEEARSLRFQLSTQQLEFERSSQTWTSLLQALEEQQKGLDEAIRKQEEYEQLVKQLQHELHNLMDLTKEEKIVFHNEMGNLRLALMTREEECQGLSDELRATVAEKDEMHVELDNLKEQLKEAKDSSAEVEEKLQKEVDGLKDESQQLRRKVVTLIREKDALWHRSDRLLQWHRILESDKWVPDQHVDKCQSCSSVFSFTLRRHHCRLCGRIFCYSCANNWLKTPGHRGKVRICNECYIVHNQASQIENNCNFHCSDSNETENGDSGLVSTVEPEIENVPLEENFAGKMDPVVVESQIYEKICKEFTVISDEEIIKSLGESSPYTRSPLAGTDYRKVWIVPVRPAETLQEDNEMEVYLNAAMIYRIPVEISCPGSLLKWKVKSKPKSVVVSVLQSVDRVFDEAAEGGAACDMENPVAMTTTRVKSLPDFTEGQELLSTAGTYYFDLDNSHSKFLAKKVTFCLHVQNPSNDDALSSSE